MRILHVVPSYLPAVRYGGPIKSVHGLCRALVKKGHDVHVFTTNVDGNKDSDVPLERPVDIDGVKVWYFSSRFMRRVYWSPFMQKALGREIKNFDLVHLHSIFLWPTWAAARAARHAGVPYIVAPRGMLVRELIRRKNRLVKSMWIRLIERMNIEKAAAVHVTSEGEKEEILRFGFNLPRLVIVPNGVDMPADIKPYAEISEAVKEIVEKGPYILFLSRVNWKKGLDRLIAAMSFVHGSRLIIAGNDEDNYRPRLEKLAAANRVDDRILFLGPVYGNDKIFLFRHASVFVLPSYSENFGIVALEAMAAGCPVVVTPEVGLSDTVSETGSGMVVPGDPESLASGINSLLSNPSLMRQMGENGKKVVKERFTWEAVAVRMESIYQDIIR